MQQLKHIKLIDLFGREIKLKLREKEKFQSLCGGFVSAVLAITTISFVSIQFLHAYRGHLVSVNRLVEPVKLHLTNKNIHSWEKNFTFGFSVPDRSIIPYLSVKSSIGNYMNNFEEKLIDCSKEVYQHLGFKIPQNMTILCIKMSTKLIVGNIFPRIEIGVCQNIFESLKFFDENPKKIDKKDPKNKDKKSKRLHYGTACEKIPSPDSPEFANLVKKLKKFQVYLFTSESEEDYMKRHMELENEIHVTKLYASIDFQKQHHQFMRFFKVTTSKSLFNRFPDKVGFLETRDHSDIISIDSSGYLLRAQIVMDLENMVTIHRKYQSYISLISYLGGLFKGLSIFFLVFVWPFREVQYYTEFINKMFTVCSNLSDFEANFPTSPRKIRARISKTYQSIQINKGSNDGSGKLVEKGGKKSQASSIKPQQEVCMFQGFLDKQVKKEMKNKIKNFIHQRAVDSFQTPRSRSSSLFSPRPLIKISSPKHKKGLKERRHTKRDEANFGALLQKRYSENYDPRLVERIQRKVKDKEKGLQSSNLLRIPEAGHDQVCEISDKTVLDEPNNGSKLKSSSKNGSQESKQRREDRAEMAECKPFADHSFGYNHFRRPNDEISNPEDGFSDQIERINQKNPGLPSPREGPFFHNLRSSERNLSDFNYSESLFKRNEHVESTPKTLERGIPTDSLRRREDFKDNQEDQNNDEERSIEQIGLADKILDTPSVTFHQNPFQRPTLSGGGGPDSQGGNSSKAAKSARRKLKNALNNYRFRQKKFLFASKSNTKPSKLKPSKLSSLGQKIKDQTKEDNGGASTSPQGSNEKIENPKDKKVNFFKAIKGVSKSKKDTSNNQKSNQKFSLGAILGAAINKNSNNQNDSNSPEKNGFSPASSPQSSSSESEQNRNDRAYTSFFQSVKALQNKYKNKFKNLDKQKESQDQKDEVNVDTEKESPKKAKSLSPAHKVLATAIRRVTTIQKVKEIEKKRAEEAAKKEAIKKDRKLRLSFLEHLTVFMPENWFSTPKKRVFLNGVKLIDQKLDITAIVHSLNEFEKLKMLLFDENQYYLFEHIPKPILFDKKILDDDDDEKEQGQPESGDQDGRGAGVKAKQNSKSKGLFGSRKKKKKFKDQILSFNCEFWHRKSSKEEKMENFRKALCNVSTKKDPSFIDLRLIEILQNMVEI